MVPLLGAISFAVGSTVKQTVDASVFLFVVGAPACLGPSPAPAEPACRSRQRPRGTRSVAKVSSLGYSSGPWPPACLPACLPALQTHPYDVGDIIVFNDAWHRVEEITLPATVLLRTADSAKIWCARGARAPAAPALPRMLGMGGGRRTCVRRGTRHPLQLPVPTGTGCRTPTAGTQTACWSTCPSRT